MLLVVERIAAGQMVQVMGHLVVESSRRSPRRRRSRGPRGLPTETSDRDSDLRRTGDPERIRGRPGRVAAEQRLASVVAGRHACVDEEIDVPHAAGLVDAPGRRADARLEGVEIRKGARGAPRAASRPRRAGLPELVRACLRERGAARARAPARAAHRDRCGRRSPGSGGPRGAARGSAPRGRGDDRRPRLVGSAWRARRRSPGRGARGRAPRSPWPRPATA